MNLKGHPSRFWHYMIIADGANIYMKTTIDATISYRQNGNMFSVSVYHIITAKVSRDTTTLKMFVKVCANE